MDYYKLIAVVDVKYISEEQAVKVQFNTDIISDQIDTLLEAKLLPQEGGEEEPAALALELVSPRVLRIAL